MKLLSLLGFTSAAMATTALLPAYPLAVKSPYLSTWYPGPSGDNFTSSCPYFWTQAPLTWEVLVRVNGNTYTVFGCPDSSIPAATQTGRQVTATHTYITMKAGPVTFQLDFFSPVSLTNYVRQSIPYSYLTVSVQNAPRVSSIQIMSAIDDSWTAQAPNTQVELSKTRKSTIYSLSGVNSIPLTEISDQATYGNTVFAADSGAGQVTHQVGSPSAVKDAFKQWGSLKPNPGSYQSGDLVALAYELPRRSKPSPVSFAIGFERNETILWLTEPLTGYYKSEFSTTEEVVDHFFSDEQAARKEGSSLDAKTIKTGKAISSNYSDVLEASVRQTWGGMELTIPLDTKDTSQTRAFMKEISTDGNVNTLADLVPKALPALYYLAPEYIRLLLQPMMEYALIWPANFAFHDLGKNYPNATGETVAGEEMLLIDQTAVIHWMAYAYQKASGNTQWIKPYLAPLQKYADYLVTNGLFPPSQKSSVDSIGPTPNQTVLAIYSAIGLTAFGALSNQANYTKVGKDYATKIVEMGLDSNKTHIKAHYNDSDSSWITTYPTAFDVMLGLDTFDKSLNQLQSDWYEKQLHPFGMQFYSGVAYTVSELSLWAASTSSKTVRNSLINAVHAAYTADINNTPGPTQWNVTNPGVGEWFLSTSKSNVGSYWMVAVNDL